MTPAPGPGDPVPFGPDLIVESANLTVVGALGQSGAFQVRVDAVIRNQGNEVTSNKKPFEARAVLQGPTPASGMLQFAPLLYSWDSFWTAPVPGVSVQLEPLVFVVSGPIKAGHKRAVSAPGLVFNSGWQGVQLVLDADTNLVVKESKEQNNRLAVDLSGIGF